MIKRFFLICLTLCSIVSSVLFLNIPSAKAWTGDTIPACSFSITPQAIIDSAMALHGYYFYQSDITGFSYVLYQTPSQMTTENYTFTIVAGTEGTPTTLGAYDPSPGNHAFAIAGQNDAGGSWASKKILHIPYNSTTLSVVDNFTTPNSSSTSIGGIGCLSYTSPNLTFDTSYTGSHDIRMIAQDQDPNAPGEPEPCAALDIPCYIGNFVDSIVDGFQSMANFLTEMFTSLLTFFVDLLLLSENTIPDFFNNLSMFFTNKLGFLLAPFDFFGDLFDALFADSLPACSEGPNQMIGGIQFGSGSNTFFGHTFPMGSMFCAVPSRLPAVWFFVQTFITAITVFGLILGFNKKIKGVLEK